MNNEGIVFYTSELAVMYIVLENVKFKLILDYGNYDLQRQVLVS